MRHICALIRMVDNAWIKTGNKIKNEKIGKIARNACNLIRFVVNY